MVNPMKSISNHKLNDALRDAASTLNGNDLQFFNRIYGEGIEKYDKRIRAMDLCGADKVLDAGCGFGQWSIALAINNRQVYSYDNSEARISTLERIIGSCEINNISAACANLSDLPLADCSVNTVFAYSVLQCTDWRRVLQEFRRVLVPQGRLYFNSNALGWYLYLWDRQPNPAGDYDPRSVAAKAFLDTLEYERKGRTNSNMSLIMDPIILEAYLYDIGFTNVAVGPEGSLGFANIPMKKTSFLPTEYMGMAAVFEMSAIAK
jgi:SAM-dependent methyltransferase